MIHVICDKCGKDAGLNAFVFTVEVINNPCPVHIFDAGELKITCDHTKMRMIVCQTCYRSFGFPNIHKAVREKKLIWRDKNDAVEEVHSRWEKSVEGYKICHHCKADVAVFSGHTNYCPNCGAKMDGERNGEAL